MYKIISYFIVVTALFVISCKNTTRNMVDNYVPLDTLFYPDPVDTLCSNYIDEISYINLMQSENHIIPEATKIEEQNNRIFIFNKNLHKIVVYSSIGNFLYEINHVGKGSQEYLEIANFTVSNKYVYIIDNYKHQIVKYDVINGNYIDRKDIGFVAWDLECLSENEFLFTFLPNNPKGKVEMEQPNGAVWKTDSTFSNIVEEYLPYHKKHIEMIGKNAYFTRCKQGIVFHSHQNNGYIIFPDGQQTPQYTHLILPQSVPSISEAKYEDIIRNDYMYLSETPFITDDYIIFAVGKGNMDEPVLMEKKSKKFEKNKECDSFHALLLPSYVKDNKFVTYLSDYELYQDLVSDGFPIANEQIEQTLSNGGACLVIYSMK